MLESGIRIFKSTPAEKTRSDADVTMAHRVSDFGVGDKGLMTVLFVSVVQFRLYILVVLVSFDSPWYLPPRDDSI
jgi:hypothetical protein